MGVAGRLSRPTPRNLAYLARHNRLVEWVTFVVWAIRRSRPFRERLAFIRRELWAERGVLSEYRLRKSGLTALIRHRSRDAAVVEEVFVRDWYRPPDGATAALAAAGTAPRIVGLGGHIGLFGLRMRELWPDAEVLEFEPEPESAAILRRCIAANGLEDRWDVIEAFAATADGEQRFVAGKSAISTAGDQAAPGEEITVPGVDVFPRLAQADLIKLDIEGGEWAVLADPRFLSVPARGIVLEHHPQLCPDPSPRRLASELLESAGYRVEQLWCKENEVGMLWAWREGR